MIAEVIQKYLQYQAIGQDYDVIVENLKSKQDGMWSFTFIKKYNDKRISKKEVYMEPYMYEKIVEYFQSFDAYVLKDSKGKIECVTLFKESADKIVQEENSRADETEEILHHEKTEIYV